MGWPSGTDAKHFKNSFVATEQNQEAPENPAWLAVMAFHLYDNKPGKQLGWHPFPVRSRTTLIRRGVIVWEHDLPIRAGASCHLFTSADNLKVDASGLRLVGVAPPLNPNIKASLLAWLKRQPVSFSVRKAELLSGQDAAMGIVALGGLCLVGGGAGLLAGVISCGIALKVKGISLGLDDSSRLEEKFLQEFDELVFGLEQSRI